MNLLNIFDRYKIPLIVNTSNGNVLVNALEKRPNLQYFTPISNKIQSLDIKHFYLTVKEADKVSIEDIIISIDSIDYSSNPLKILGLDYSFVRFTNLVMITTQSAKPIQVGGIR